MNIQQFIENELEPLGYTSKTAYDSMGNLVDREIALERATTLGYKTTHNSSGENCVYGRVTIDLPQDRSDPWSARIWFPNVHVLFLNHVKDKEGFFKIDFTKSDGGVINIDYDEPALDLQGEVIEPLVKQLDTYSRLKRSSGALNRRRLALLDSEGVDVWYNHTYYGSPLNLTQVLDEIASIGYQRDRAWDWTEHQFTLEQALKRALLTSCFLTPDGDRGGRFTIEFGETVNDDLNVKTWIGRMERLRHLSKEDFVSHGYMMYEWWDCDGDFVIVPLDAPYFDSQEEFDRVMRILD